MAVEWFTHSLSQTQHNEQKKQQQHQQQQYSLFLFSHSFTRLFHSVGKCQIANTENTVSRPAAYLQLIPNFGWIECITSTHETRQRDAKWWWKIQTQKKARRNHQHTTKYYAHSLIHSLVIFYINTRTHQSNGVRSSSLSAWREYVSGAAYMPPRAFSNMKARVVLHFVHVDRMTVDVLYEYMLFIYIKTFVHTFNI